MGRERIPAMQGRLLLWIAASLLGCSAEVDDSDGVGSEPGTGGSPSAQGGDAASGGATGPTATGGSTAGGAIVNLDCEPGIPVSSQLPFLKNRQYDNVIRDLLGVTTLAEFMGLPPSAALLEEQAGPLNSSSWAAYQSAANLIATQVMGDPALKANFMTCDPAAESTCYEATIRAFGRKAFRRPLTEGADSELEQFLKLTTIESTPPATPEQISRMVLYAFLVSPSFLMAPEIGTEPGDGPGEFKLTQHEIATRLALALWGSMPDAELSQAADGALLDSAEALGDQAARMLSSERMNAQIRAAVDAYLNLSSSRWGAAVHNAETYPLFTNTPEQTAALQAEITNFFEDVLLNDGSFRDLFVSNVAFVNNLTAPLYGLEAADYGDELTRVELDAQKRPGFLTRVGFLHSFSSYEATSPILRGSFIASRLLGVPIGVPDPSAGVPLVPSQEFSTRREQVEALTSSKPCSVCHTALINPPGYALENYDTIGSWQTEDPLGGAIDPTAEITFADSTTKTVSTPLELMHAIAGDPSARRIFAQSLVSLATQRAPNDNDECVVLEIADKLGDEDFPALEALTDIATSPAFAVRRSGD